MKKLLSVLLALCLLCACGVTRAEEELKADVDLTPLGKTMLYAYVMNMMNAPEGFVGQRFKVSGVCDENRWEETATTYHYILIADEAGCCALGFEYVLEDGEYPAPGSAIELTGVLETYEELGSTYIQLRVEKMNVNSAA